ncbi:MAG: YrhK family protein [Pseudomonadota bacterium]
MTLFHPDRRELSARHKRLWALYEILTTLVDFLAAVLFVFGSILFFREETVTLGTWLFLAGSLFFALSPTIRLTRELHYWRIGQIDKLAERARD